MPTGKIQKIVLFGAGNLASNLAPELARKGFEIIQVCNRTPSKGMRLAKKVKAVYIDHPAKVSDHADLYILAVSDDAIGRIAGKMGPKKGIVIHMSGTKEAGILRKISKRSGVIYPVQTFSGSRLTGFRGVPLCIEAKEKSTGNVLAGFASALSGRVLKITGRQRRMIHLGAVFANNFPNFMYGIAHALLEENGISEEILHPLIRKTAGNLQRGAPFRFQTGPAMREDKSVLREHLAWLKSHPAFKKIYQVISESIIQYKKANDKLQGTA